MIQRIQSLYLLVAAVCSGVLSLTTYLLVFDDAVVYAIDSISYLVLFEGSPFFTDGNRLANIISEEKVTHFGTSAKYLDACSKADEQSCRQVRLYLKLALIMYIRIGKKMFVYLR